MQLKYSFRNYYQYDDALLAGNHSHVMWPRGTRRPDALTRQNGGPRACVGWWSVTGSHAVEVQPRGGQGNRPLSTCRGALLHGFRHWARQATVTDYDEQSVTNRLLCAHIADSARLVMAAIARAVWLRHFGHTRPAPGICLTLRSTLAHRIPSYELP